MVKMIGQDNPIKCSPDGIHYYEKDGYIYSSDRDMVYHFINLFNDPDNFISYCKKQFNYHPSEFDIPSRLSGNSVINESLMVIVISYMIDAFKNIPHSPKHLDSMKERNRQAYYTNPIKHAEPVPVNTDVSGYVYLFHYEEKPGQYKIGMTTGDVYKRLSNYATGTLDTLILDHVIHTGNARRLEKAFHKKFKSKRIKREWFALDEQDIAYIKSFSDRSITDGKE